MTEKRPGGKGRKQELQLQGPVNPREVMTDENKALLSYFASEVARYLEIRVGTRLDDLEVHLRDMESRSSAKEAEAIREVMRLFSRYKLFRILQALSRLASEDRGFTKNSLIREAGVGQGFRREGLDRLIEIFCTQGLLMEVGRRGRGLIFSATAAGKKFLDSYVPKFPQKQDFHDCQPPEVEE